MRKSAFTFALLLGAAAAPAAAESVIDLPGFRAIEVIGGGRVTVRHGAVQRVTLVKGDSAISRIEVSNEQGAGGRLMISPCRRSCNLRNYEFEVEVVTPHLDAAAIRGGGSVEAEGDFPRQPGFAAAITGGGEIDARALEPGTMAASVTGGGTILADPRSSLTAQVTGGGEIVYWGDPQVTQATQGGGTIRRGNRR